MKKHLLLTGMLFAVGFTGIKAQSFDLESWVTVTVDEDGFPLDIPYENPATPYLSTLNRISTYPSTPPITGFKEGNAHSGQFCARITAATVNAMNIFVPGVLGTVDSYFNPQGFGATLQIPHYGRPAALNAWIKYTPVNGDSAEIFAYVLKDNGGSFETLGVAKKAFYSAVNSWTEQNLSFNYSNTTDVGTHLSMAFVTSKAYDFSDLTACQGQNGSSMWVDDVSLVGWNGVKEMLFTGEEIMVFPNPTTDLITVSLTQDISEATLIILDMNGREISSKTVSGNQFSADVSTLSAGNYVVVLKEKNTIWGRKTFVKK